MSFFLREQFGHTFIMRRFLKKLIGDELWRVRLQKVPLDVKQLCSGWLEIVIAKSHPENSAGRKAIESIKARIFGQCQLTLTDEDATASDRLVISDERRNDLN
jgi:hypothetical protein